MFSSPPPAARPALEVSDILRGEAESLLGNDGFRLSREQQRVVRDLLRCRTAALGGHLQACDRCDHREISYNSCRNRHCPKCQGSARAGWLAEREADLLPIPYFHIVFTLPAEVGALALGNKRRLYGMLFEAASQTLLEVAGSSRRLRDAELGVLAVLHTWGQNLQHHPHLHCVVAGGGLARDGSRWIGSSDGYFLPVRLLSHVFRDRFGRLLRKAFDRGELLFHGQLTSLADAEAFQRFVGAVTGRPWVVYAKRPFHDPSRVLKYLARYTHRVAISNHRLIAYRDGRVTFRYKDYAKEGRERTMTLTAGEFIRRFLLHVLPEGFMRIRHYGFLANRHRREKLAACRRALGVAPVAEADRLDGTDKELAEAPAEDARGETMDAAQAMIPCPRCQVGRMQTIETFEGHSSPQRRPSSSLVCQPSIPYQDSS